MEHDPPFSQGLGLHASAGAKGMTMRSAGGTYDEYLSIILYPGLEVVIYDMRDRMEIRFMNISSRTC